MDSLSAAPAGLDGTPTSQVGTNFKEDSFDIIFGLAGTKAVSLLAIFVDAINFDQTVGGLINVNVFDTANNRIGGLDQILVSSYVNPDFLGILAEGNEMIGRINIKSSTPDVAFLGADDIAVYTPDETTPPDVVPLPGALGFLFAAMGGLLAFRRTG